MNTNAKEMRYVGVEGARVFMCSETGVGEIHVSANSVCSIVMERVGDAMRVWMRDGISLGDMSFQDDSAGGSYTLFSCATNTLVLVGQGATVFLHERRVVLEDSVAEQVICVTEYRLELRARLTVFYDRQEVGESRTYGTAKESIVSYLGEHSSFEMHYLWTEAIDSHTTISLHLEGKHAQARVRGAVLLTTKSKQIAECMVYQYHHAAHTCSDVMIKGLVGGVAQFAYQGLISIAHEAKDADAVQENKNMLLGSGARATSIPSLEILTDDVRCAHGSAVGYLDDEQVWYLQSRGFSLDEAQYQLVRAFVREIFSEAVVVLAGKSLERMLKKLGKYTP